jgi:hypothetical protein
MENKYKKLKNKDIIQPGDEAYCAESRTWYDAFSCHHSLVLDNIDERLGIFRRPIKET